MEKTKKSLFGPMDLTKGTCWKTILIFSLPVILFACSGGARMQEGMRHVYTPHCVVKADAESAFEGFRVQVPAGWYDPCATGSKRA